MPNFFKLLSPVSLLIGLLSAAGLVAILWPVPRDVIAPLVLLTVLLVGAGAELARRLIFRKQGG